MAGNSTPEGNSSPVMETEKMPEKTGDQQPSESRKATEQSRITVPYYKLFSFADSFDYLLMFFGTIAAIGNGSCMPLMALLFGDVIDITGKTTNTDVMVHRVFEVSLKYVYLALGAGVASFIRERQAARIRNLYLKMILRQDIGFFDKETTTGEIVGRISGDTALIQDAIGEKVGKFIQMAGAFLGGFVLALMRGWLLTLVMLCTIPPLVISGAVTMKLISKLATHEQRAYSIAATIVEQTIGSIRTVAAYTGEKLAISMYNKSLVKAYKSGVQEGLAAGLGQGTLFFCLYAGYALAVWFGAKLILEKGYTGGDVIIVILGVLLGSTSFGQAAPNLSAFAAGQAAAFKMFEVINKKPEIDAYEVNGLKLDDIHGDIELRDVKFSYPARPDEQILHGFSLSIPRGTTAALIGQSGSGKSTVISLIDRFYDPQAGEVLIDGVNLREFQVKWIREKIGLVSQEPVLFASTIRDNIAYGKAGATNEEIKAAAELANAASFINKLPQGLDTMVGEHGIQLSGGQKQRVAIARAIIKDPRILLLDEATSALDAESERMVQEALDRVMINRTTVIVAHRLTTIINADNIAVMQQGKIVEKGSHSELLKDPDGVYSQLIKLQETGKELEQQNAGNHYTGSGCGSSSEQQYAENYFIGSGRSSFSEQQYAVNYYLAGIPGYFAGQFMASPTTPRVSISEKVFEEPFDIPLSETSQLSQGVPLGRLARLNSPEIPTLLLGAVAAIANGSTTPIFGLLLASMIKTFYEPEDALKRDSTFWALMFLSVGAAALLTTPLSAYCFAVAGCKLVKRIRLMCFEKVVYMEIGWFDKAEHSSGVISARLCSDAALVRGLIGDTLAMLVQNSATVVAGLVIAFQANRQLSLIFLALFPLLGVSLIILIKSTHGFSKNAKKLYEEACQVVSDAIGSIRTVASFCAEEKVMQSYQKKCEGPIKQGIKQGLIGGLGFGLSYFFFFFIYAICFYVGGLLVSHGKANFTEFFRAFFALTMTAYGISQSSSLAPDVAKARSSATSVFGLLDQTSKIDSCDSRGLILENVDGRVEFRHVCFHYPTRPDIDIFRDLCLTIDSGKTVALVGESGSGKSTVISLLQRFYDPISGDITLDGVEIQKLQLKWLRQQMGLVSQEPVLFNDTIRANIAYGKEGDVTESEIFAAAELANVHSFISGLQQGYDTQVGERGIQLSGGQKQRVAIARAMVRSPRILLLDEATSALDVESERVVQDALDRVRMNRTTIVVAHRLSTIKGADLIAVIRDGIIAEKGSMKL